MNATTFLTNISESLHSLETKTSSIPATATIINEIKFKLEEIQKSNSSLAALIQKQNNSINQHNESIEKNIDQLKLNQDNILNKIDEILTKTANQSEALIRQK